MMRLRNIWLKPLGVIAVLGIIGAAWVLADEGEKAAPVHADVLKSWGNTQVIAERDAGAMFSHKLHVIEQGLDCDSCHPDIFKKKRGAAAANGDYTMAAMEEGKYCGTCHDSEMLKDPKSCKTCHGSDMKQPKTIVFTVPVKAVVFDHEAHTLDLGLECSECHSKLFKMKLGDAEQQPESFVMEALYKGKYCGACHNGDEAFASNTRCTTCHIGVKGFVRLVHGATAEEGGEEKQEHH
jgi:c(7)-type cytochrome triheme protein